MPSKKKKKKDFSVGYGIRSKYVLNEPVSSFLSSKTNFKKEISKWYFIREVAFIQTIIKNKNSASMKGKDWRYKNSS